MEMLQPSQEIDLERGVGICLAVPAGEKDSPRVNVGTKEHHRSGCCTINLEINPS